MDSSHKNILNFSSNFSPSTPRFNDSSYSSDQVMTSSMEAELSPFKDPLTQEQLKIAEDNKRVLSQALEFKKKKQLREYYGLINKQTFVNAKEESQALLIWMRVFKDFLSILIDDYKDMELLELLLFKLPWFSPTTTHGQNFDCYSDFCLSLFQHDLSQIQQFITNLFSPHGIFQCMMIGSEHRPLISELLWDRSHETRETIAKLFAEKMQTCSELIETEASLKQMRKMEDIFKRSRQILSDISDQKLREGNKINCEVTKVADQIFLKTLFSFHKNKMLSPSGDYSIQVGVFQNTPSFLILHNQQQLKQFFSEEDKAISIKKSMLGLQSYYIDELKVFAERKYQRSSLKQKARLLSQILKQFPFSESLILDPLLEKFPHKNMPVENIYLYHKFCMEIAKEVPSIEGQILETIVERLCFMDVDIKVKRRKYEFSDFTKIQSLESLTKALQSKFLDEKEIKLGILLNQLLEYLEERLTSKDNLTELVDFLLKIFERKIFPITKLNFMQYLPLFVMTQQTNTTAQQLFVQKFLTFHIIKAFNIVERQHIGARIQAWNYLASFISREQGIIQKNTLEKCLRLVLRYYNQVKQESKKNSTLQRQKSRSTSIESSQSTQEVQGNKFQKTQFNVSYEQTFKHCFIQGLAMILITKQEEISIQNERLYEDLFKIAFKGNLNSLFYASPLMLFDLINTCSKNGKFGTLKEKAKNIFKKQKQEMCSSKLEIFNKISKYMPYDMPVYLFGIKDYIQPFLKVPYISNEEQQFKEIITNNPEVVMQNLEESSQMELEEEKKNKVNEKFFKQSSSILFEPELIHNESKMENEDKIQLTEAIHNSRKNDFLFQQTTSMESDLEEKKVIHVNKKSNNMEDKKMNNEMNENEQIQLEENEVEDCEVISSSRETEYSMSPNKNCNNSFLKNQNQVSQSLFNKKRKNQSQESQTQSAVPTRITRSSTKSLIQKQTEHLTTKIKEENRIADMKFKQKQSQKPKKY